jgi:hypothetical protein
MTETHTSDINLADVVDLINGMAKFDFFYYDKDRDHLTKVEYYGNDAIGDGMMFLFGFEYGPTHLICADSEHVAYDIWLDLLKPVPLDEIHEAYNAFDKLLDYMCNKGYENDRHLHSFCNRWGRYYFQVDTKDANMTGAWDRWELDEAYQYQPNATDSGIVYVGHYQWYRMIGPDEIRVRRRVE